MPIEGRARSSPPPDPPVRRRRGRPVGLPAAPSVLAGPGEKMMNTKAAGVIPGRFCIHKITYYLDT